MKKLLRLPLISVMAFALPAGCSGPGRSVGRIFLRKALTNTPTGYIIKIPHEGILTVEVSRMDECANCCGKTTQRSEDERRKLINRLSRIEGQVRGIRGMLENDAYCTDILVQSAAVNSAVNAFNRELIASHMRHCVARELREGRDEVIDELVLTLQKLMK